MDSLSPESRALYEILMADTTELYKSKFAAYKKAKLDAVKQFVNDTRTQLFPDHAGILNPKRGPAMESSTSSTTCSTAVLSRVVSIDEFKSDADTTMSLTSAAAASAWTSTPDVSTVLRVPTELDVVHEADDNLAAPTHDNCSTVCPAVSDLLESGNDRISMSPTNCLIMCLNGGKGTVASKACSISLVQAPGATPAAAYLEDDDNISKRTQNMLLPWSPPWISWPPSATSFNSLPANLPSLWLARLDVLESCTWSAVTCSTIRSGRSIDTPPSLLAEAYNVFNDVFTAIVSWPPPSWTRARPPLIRGQDLFHHAQQKRGKEFSVQDTKSNWHANWLDVELKPPWPSLGVCMNLPMGYSLFSLGSITVNDNTSPDANWCLDDVLWKLPRWWSHTQYVQPANAILYVSSWPWVASKHADMLFRFSNPLIPVNCDLARVHFLLSGTAQINVRSPCEASLNLVVYCEYPSLNIAHTHSWMLIIVGHHLQYGLEANALLLLISWLPVPCLQVCVVQGYPGSKGFLAIFNGEAVVQQSYTCTRVLTVNVRTGRIYHHILRGNTHYSEQMQWSFSHSLLQSEFRFCAPGHVLFSCCALVQSEISWTISLVPLKSWFRCCRAGRESLYSSENFQWAIAWSLSYHFSLTILQTRPHCSILLMQQTYPAIYKEPVFRVIVIALVEPGSSCDVPDHGNKWLMLWSTTKNQVMMLQILYRLSVIIIDFVSTGLTLGNYAMLKRYVYSCNWNTLEVGLVLASLLQVLVSCYLTRHGRSEVLKWYMSIPSLVVFRVYTKLNPYFPSFGMMRISPLEHEERQPSAILLAACTVILQSTACYSKGKSSYLTSTNVQWDSQFMDWKIPWLFHHLLVENWVQVSPTGNVCNMYKQPFLAASMDLNFHLEHSGLVCHPETTTCLFLRPPARCYLEMNSEFGRGEFSWDPGIQALLCSCGFFAEAAAKGGFIVETPNYCMNLVPWDPGGSTWPRLAVKPNFKRGGLSATSLSPLTTGPARWAATLGPCLLGSQSTRCIYTQESNWKRRPGTDRMASA